VFETKPCHEEKQDMITEKTLQSTKKNPEEMFIGSEARTGPRAYSQGGGGLFLKKKGKGLFFH